MSRYSTLWANTNVTHDLINQSISLFSSSNQKVGREEIEHRIVEGGVVVWLTGMNMKGLNLPTRGQGKAGRRRLMYLYPYEVIFLLARMSEPGPLGLPDARTVPS